MIYTVTINPAIDYVTVLSDFREGGINRSQREECHFGGKGINVSNVLSTLGMKSIALGFTAGFTGQAIESDLKSRGIATDFIYLPQGMTRINMKILGDTETEINGNGPHIGEDEITKLMAKIDLLADGDVLILSGNVPAGIRTDIYRDILKRTEGKGIVKVVDAAGDLLINSLTCRPFLIKPGRHEIEEIFGAECPDKDMAVEYGRRLQEMGAQNVLVSLGADGAVLLCDDGKVLSSGICEGRTINTVGAGDSMVAGFMAGFLKSGDYEYALRLGSAAGSGTSFNYGLTSLADIEECLPQISVFGMK